MTLAGPHRDDPVFMVDNRVLGLSYQRIQFTSDLLPADILGASIFEQDSQRFRFHKGPIFTQLMLADEVNRATPKSQSALLEVIVITSYSIHYTKLYDY